MQLSFYARGTGLVSHPTARRIVGQAPRYVGRKVVVVDGAATWPATQQPFVCEDSSPIGMRLKTRCRRGELWPADEATARACNAEFVPVEFVDGEWVMAAPKASPAAKAAKPPKD